MARTQGLGFDSDVYLFGASAETARFAKWLANELFGSPVEHAYIFGPSGGGHRSFQCLMSAPDVYDGGVPEVFGVAPGAYWSVMGLATELLGPDVAKVVDALEPGGSGDPFDGLSFEQREALRDLFWMGFPTTATTQLVYLSVYPFPMYSAMDANPDYFTDFWSKKGYLGADAPQRLASRLQQIRTTVREVVHARGLSAQSAVARQLATGGMSPNAQYGAILDGIVDPVKLRMAKLTIKTGKAASREMLVANVVGDAVVPFSERCPELFTDVDPGDEIEVDNRDWIAFTYIYLHSVEFNVPGLHRADDRVPLEYRRFAVNGAPVHRQIGPPGYALDEVTRLRTKMIYIGATCDAPIWPTIVTPFERYVRQVLGDNADDQFRLWFSENSPHTSAEGTAMMNAADSDPATWQTRLVEYEGMAAQALRDVVAWVEQGVAPPSNTNYQLSEDSGLQLPGSAAERGGIQPVVKLLVNGGSCAEARVGEPVTFAGTVDVPPTTGTVVEAAIDFDMTDSWPYQDEMADGSSASLNVSTTYSYDAPGTYFPCLRAGSHRDGHEGRGLSVRNLGRARVVVLP